MGMETIYTEIILTTASRLALLGWLFDEGIEPLERIQCHHITIRYKPPNIDNLPVGQRVVLRVKGYTYNENIQAVAVEVKTFYLKTTLIRDPIEFFGIENKVPHITVSTDSKTSPVKSNELLEKGVALIKDGPMLEGVVGYFNGVQHITEGGAA